MKSDQNRLVREYQTRVEVATIHRKYSSFNKQHLFMIQERQHATIRLLHEHRFETYEYLKLDAGLAM